jgi:hypothetical protein
MAKSNDTPIEEILKGVSSGTTRLPEFHRSWVWNDEQIRQLIASVTQSYPIGAVMFLEYGGEGIRFKSRPFTNIPDPDEDVIPNLLVLDGQQRITSIYCTMQSQLPVPVKRGKKSENLYYYLDIKKCLDSKIDRIEAVISVPEDKIVREDFGRKIVLDLNERENEFRSHLFPLNLVYNQSEALKWRAEYRKFFGNNSPEILSRLDTFDLQVIYPLLNYRLPVIQLEKNTPKEAVCQVFENVNTGGITLTVFDLVIATLAANDFALRDDWETRKRKMNDIDVVPFDLLSVVKDRDFLVSVTLLAQKKANKTLACKQKDILDLALDDYKNNAEAITDGYIKVAHYLIQHRIFSKRDLPYAPQLIPLSVLMAILGNKADGGRVKSKLDAWYWCGVFGEKYRAALETQYVKDVSDILSWIEGGSEPDAVTTAFFHPNRLFALKSRTPAAYKGIISLILKENALDFISGIEMGYSNFISESVDLHHIFPVKYCKKQGYDTHQYDCIINKTLITARTNKMIGSAAPSVYLRSIEKNVSADTLNKNIETH